MEQETERKKLERQAESLIRLWNVATVRYDLSGRAACFLEAMQLMRERGKTDHTDTLMFFDDKIKLLIYAALEAVSHHEGGVAAYYLSYFPENILGTLCCLPDYRYWQGRAAYEQQDWSRAAEWFRRQIAYDGTDELAWFFLGNCCWQQGQSVEALTAYTTALERNLYFEEAQVNAAVVLRELGEVEVASGLLQQLERFSWLKKAGPALAIEDISFYDKEWIQGQEAPNWIYPVASDVYAAAIDTTFALYRPYHRYVLQEAVRLGGACAFHHLPWYYDYQELSEDEQYYLDHAGGSSTIAKWYRGKEFE